MICATKHIILLLFTILLYGCPGDSSPNKNTNLTFDQSSAMLVGDWVPENTHQIDFENLPKVPAEHVVVSDVRNSGGTKVNQHNYIHFYNGRYWLMWSDGPGEPKDGVSAEQHRHVVPKHDRANQRVSYAYSKDGLDWSPIFNLTGMPKEGYGWIARGFWEREGKLYALASHYKATSYKGDSLHLDAFELIETNQINWHHKGIIKDNTLNNFAPKKLPNGEWMMSRRDSIGDVFMMIGGVKSLYDWKTIPIVQRDDADLVAEEPYWWVLPDQNLIGLFRDNKKSGYLFRAFSTDNGQTWSKPSATNFPDATSKFSAAKLPDGRHVMVSNPKPSKRDPLTIAISEDGLIFSKMGYLVGGRHVDYPHVITHDGYIFVAFAGAKQTVEVLKIKISDLDKINN